MASLGDDEASGTSQHPWRPPASPVPGANSEPSWPQPGSGPSGGLPSGWPPPGPARSHPPQTAPWTRSDAGLWILFGLLGYIVGQVVALLAIGVSADLAGQSGHLSAIERMAAPPSWYIGAGLVGLWCGFFVGPFAASRFRGTKSMRADLGLSFQPIDLVGIAIGVGGQILVTLLYLPFISHLKNFSAPTTKLTGSAHGVGFAVIGIFTVLCAPFFEELFFRGLLLRALIRLFCGERRGERALPIIGVGFAIALDGIIFGAAHAELAQFAGLAIFGTILALIAYRTGRLGMNITAHATFNLIAVLAVASSRTGLIH
jgi:uncharacterized protein